MQPQSSKNNEKRMRLLLKAVKYLTVLLLVGALALFEYLCPFRSLLSAEQVSAREEGELRIHFLYAGTGDCTVVEFPEGDLLVVDGGDGSFGSDVTRYIRGLNSKSLTVIATSPKSEHVGGLAEIVSFFPVEEVYLPAVGAETGAYRRFLVAAEQAGCTVKTLTRYGCFARSSGAYAVCLSPYSAEETDADEASAVLYLEYEGVRVLLCSDMTAAREARLKAEYEIDGSIFDSGTHRVRLEKIDVLKVAAHGARTASSEEWLSLTEPKTAIVSCGRGSGKFAEDTAKRLSSADVFRTDELGNIVVSIRGGDYRVLTEGI